MNDLPWRLRAWLIRALGVKECGQYGGNWRIGKDEARWCQKPFGHEDSCMFDTGIEQPGTVFRAKFKGWHR